MSTTFDTLPDIIIEEILRILEFEDQVKLRFCNKRISRLLQYIVFEDVSEPKDDNYCKSMVLQFGKYVKRLRLKVNNLLEDMDAFPNLNHIEINTYVSEAELNQMHLLEIKEKPLYVFLSKQVPTQSQFNINRIIENLVKLRIGIRNRESEGLDGLKMIQLPSLKTLILQSGRYFPDDTLVYINQNFPNLITLELVSIYRLPIFKIPATFLKIKKLVLYLIGYQNYQHFPFQSFQDLKVLKFDQVVNAGVHGNNIIKKKVPEQLLALTIEMYEFSMNDVLKFKFLRHADLKLNKDFDADSMQNLLSLPKLSHLILRGDIHDNKFKDITCKSPLNSLTIDEGLLYYSFIEFLQTNVPLLTRLQVNTRYKEYHLKDYTYEKSFYQSSLNLLFLITNRNEVFINWVKLQCPNVNVKYLDSDN